MIRVARTCRHQRCIRKQAANRSGSAMCKSCTACLKSNNVWSSRCRALMRSCCSNTCNSGTKCNFLIPTLSHQFCKRHAASFSRCRRIWLAIHSFSFASKFWWCCTTWEQAASCLAWTSAREPLASASSCCRNATLKSARCPQSAMPKELAAGT